MLISFSSGYFHTGDEVGLAVSVHHCTIISQTENEHFVFIYSTVQQN